MNRVICCIAFVLMVSCARAPQKALWECVEMDIDSTRTVNDSIARFAYNYYSRHGSKRNRMMATYYLGQAEYDAGQIIPATLHFKQAYDLSAKLKDTTYMGYSCQRLSFLYSQNLDNAQSAFYAREAIPLLEYLGDTLIADYSRIHLAGYYLSQRDFKKAESIVDSLLESNPSYWDNNYYISIVKGNIHFFQKDYGNARLYYERVIDISPLEPIYYGRLALISEHQGERTLSDSLLALSAKRLVTREDSVNYYANKTQIAAIRDDFKTAYHNQSLAYNMQDTIVYNTLSRSVTHAMQTFFEQEYLAEKTKRENLGIIYLFSTLLLLIIIIITVIALHRRKEQVISHMAQMETIDQELQQMRLGQAGYHSVISTLVQDRIKSMSQLANAYLSWSDEAVSLREMQYGKSFKEDIITEFRKELRSLRDDEHFIPSIEEALNQSNNSIMARIRQDCKGIRNGDIRVNEKDFNLLVLFFAGFSNNSVAFILDMTDDAVRTRKKNIRKIFLSMENEHGKEYLAMLSKWQHKTATNNI